GRVRRHPQAARCSARRAPGTGTCGRAPAYPAPRDPGWRTPPRHSRVARHTASAAGPAASVCRPGRGDEGTRRDIERQLGEDGRQVRPLLPGTAGSMVLVTSRSRLTSLVAHEGAYPIPLPLLSQPESRSLLAGHLGDERMTHQASEAEELIALCARLPLALSI